MSGREEKLIRIFKEQNLTVFEYNLVRDRMIIYDDSLCESQIIQGYLTALEEHSSVCEEDYWKVKEVLSGIWKGPAEIRCQKDGIFSRKQMSGFVMQDEVTGENIVVGSIRDITEEKNREKLLEEQTKRDSMTGAYNYAYGKTLINEYLDRKNPYEACGILVVDIDYFKSVNDNYGHLFGDKVLVQLVGRFQMLFDTRDIVMRSGGDEFVIFLKDIDNLAFERKAKRLVESVQGLNFGELDYIMSCSVGACFLPGNYFGYTYEQLFGNADWALYQAKERGRNCCVFCDNLRQFESIAGGDDRGDEEVDARYLRNDIVATAFEIFEKASSFRLAVAQLMKVVGIRCKLDRITIVRTDIEKKEVTRLYQWISRSAPEVLDAPGGFTKEDFQTLFQSYDEYETAVLQYDRLEMYSPEAAALLVQGDAKTTLYAAMYCEGKYIGAISYVVCKNKRYWSKYERCQFGELTKIIAAHLAKSNALNFEQKGCFLCEEHDQLTGLMSFHRFREDTERLIVSGHAKNYAMIYTDFVDFKQMNQAYGYTSGDNLLQEFVNYIIDGMQEKNDTYYTRVMADHFLMFKECRNEKAMEKAVRDINEAFRQLKTADYPDANLQLRSGVYVMGETCFGAAEAIDEANTARKQAAAENGFVKLVIGV